MLVVDRDACVLYEVFDAEKQPDGSWEAGSGAVWDLTSNAFRPAGWTSADAAGLPILPALVRADEVASGTIGHALRFTAPVTRTSYIWPARHQAGSTSSVNAPPMGAWFRLKASVDPMDFPAEVRPIVVALQTHGMILADNGSPWYMQGVPSEAWDNDLLHDLDPLEGTDFEAVDTSSLIVDPEHRPGGALALSAVDGSAVRAGHTMREAAVLEVAGGPAAPACRGRRRGCARASRGNRAPTPAAPPGGCRPRGPRSPPRCPG